jgi:hypothetical protein
MKEFFFKLAISGYVICILVAMLSSSALTPFRPTESFVGMSVCAFIALLASSKVSRWFAIAALLVGLGGSFSCWHFNSHVWATIRRLQQTQPAEDALQHTNANR